jgi:hypothetical protein
MQIGSNSIILSLRIKLSEQQRQAHLDLGIEHADMYSIHNEYKAS